jgi:hypothetical protein
MEDSAVAQNFMDNLGVYPESRHSTQDEWKDQKLSRMMHGHEIPAPRTDSSACLVSEPELDRFSIEIHLPLLKHNLLSC